MRLGIFGGSFDPVHNGHLALARACQQQAALDEVWFTPTAIQPLKAAGPLASNDARVQMLKLAIEEEPLDVAHPPQSDSGRLTGSEPAGPRSRTNWLVCALEIDRGGLSYTVDTLRQLHVELPEAKLFFMIGADAVRDVPKWKEPREIFRLATPLVVHRAGEPDADLPPVAELCAAETQPQLVEMPAVDVSSSEIRRRVAAGLQITGLVPASVERFIDEKQLYRS